MGCSLTLCPGYFRVSVQRRHTTEMHGTHTLDTLFMMHTHVMQMTLSLDPHAQFPPTPPRTCARTVLTSIPFQHVCILDNPPPCAGKALGRQPWQDPSLLSRSQPRDRGTSTQLKPGLFRQIRLGSFSKKYSGDLRPVTPFEPVSLHRVNGTVTASAG